MPSSSCELPATRKCLKGFFSSADFVHCCCLVGTLQGILFISVRGININVFVRPESEQQQRKKQPCHNAILPASSTAFTNRAARDQPTPLSPLSPLPTLSLPPCRAVPKAAFATALALCVASAFLFTCQTVFCRNKNLSRFYGHKKQVENGESPSPSPSQSHSRVEVFVLELSFEFCSALPAPRTCPCDA